MLEDDITSIVERAMRRVMREELKVFKQPEKQTELLTRKEAARFVRVSVGTIDAWSRTGVLRRFGQGKVVRYRKEDLLACLAASQTTEEITQAEASKLARRILGGRHG